MLIPFTAEAVIAYCVVLLLCLPLHEFGHAWMAARLGDVVAEREGRLTLNPAAHIDPLGAILLAIGGFGWAKPVPFNPYGLRKAPSTSVGIILVSAAGPATNLLLALIATIPFRLKLVSVFDVAADKPLAMVLYTILSINLVLAVFNLIPIPPLDGSKILASLLPPQFSNVMNFVEQYGMFLLILLIVPIFGGSSLASILISPIVLDLTRVLLGF